MTSRDTILQKLRSELSKGPVVAAPPTPVVWPCENPDPETMARRFAEELTAVNGEPIRCANIDDARRHLARLAEENGWTAVGVMDRPKAREVSGDLPAGLVHLSNGQWRPPEMAQFSAAVIEADWLLSDTGSSVIACATAEERLLCYLPPVCVVVAGVERLAEHLPAAWAEIARRVADPALRGEFVIITGPSRTADIEKILILGVHGPKRLVVLLVG